MTRVVLDLVPDGPPIPRPRGASALAGWYYEKAVTRWAYTLPGVRVAEQPALLRSRTRCFPDLLLFGNSGWDCVVVEVKLQLTERSFMQLSMYTELVRQALPGVKVRNLIICGATPPVGKPVVHIQPSDLFNLSAFHSNVLVLTRRELRAGGLQGGYNFSARPASVALWQSGSSGDGVCGSERLPRVAAQARA